FDYNGNGYDDLLLLYESGFVRLLENENSNKRFKDKGFVLNIPGGAFSGTKIDVNNDGYDDLIVGTKESCKKGEECLSLFTNINGRFERQTLNLAVDGEIYDMKVGDANADGCEDLFTSDSAGNIRIFYNKNDGKSCNGLNTNHGFSKNFGFAIDNKKNTFNSLYIYHSSVEQIYQNDIVLKTTQAEAIDLSSNENIQDKMNLEKEVQKNSTKFFRFTIPSTQLPTASASDTDPDLSSAAYAQSAFEFEQAIKSNKEIYEKVIPQQTYDKEYNFIKISEYSAFKNSTKYGLDINGQFANVGDEIQYDITLKNSTPNSFTNVMLSDGTLAAMELLKDSLKCMDSNCPDNLQWVETGVQLRSQIIKGISIPPNGSRKIQYKFKLNSVPKVNFNVGKDVAEYPSNQKDPYLDIMVRPEFKADKNAIMTHLYSTGVNSQNHVVYQKLDVAPETNKEELMQDQFANNGMPLDKLVKSTENDIETPGEKPSNYKKSQKKWEINWWKKKENRPKIDPAIEESIFSQLSNLTVDSNFNGLPNSWDGVTDNVPGQGITTCPSPSAPPGQPENEGQSGSGSTISALGAGFSNALGEFNGLANNVAGAVEGILNSLRCAGAGCLPIPYNYAFFAPHIAAPGIALLAFDVPFIPFFSFGYPSVAPSTVRFYTIPTLSGGLVISLCVGPGPGHASPCWSFAVPVGMLGICPDFAGAISDAIATAKNAINSATGGTIAISSDGSDPSGSDAASDSDMISAGGALFDPESPIQAAASVNIRIPGFPAVITDWLDRQISEVYNKLLDLPDLYIVYPDFGSLGPQFSAAAKNFKNNRGGWHGFQDFLTAVNSLPFVTIEGKEVIFKVPMVPLKEWQKYEFQLIEAIEHYEQQINLWDCDSTSAVPDNNLCHKLKADITGFIKGLESMLETLDKIANLPYEILKWKNWETKYATQIICYLDAIMTMLGGYIKKQMKIAGAWIEMVEEIIKIFKSWKMILDLVVEYQVSCDECKNDRFSLLGLLLQLFMVIPSPPIIPLPKPPDIVVDFFSKSSIGATITWPDIVFRPEPLYLPDIPLVSIPILPDLNFKLPTFKFDLQLPQLPDLPDLPPLPIPKLPDLPRPPKIPALPDVVVSLLANLKPIFKILCLLKKGLIPVPEAFLATEAETLTQPNLDVVLPILAALSFQLPAISYDYVKEVRIGINLDLSINADPIYNVVKLTTEKWNIFLKKLVSKLNEVTKYPLQEVIDEALEKLMASAIAALADSISNAFKDDTKLSSGDIEIEDLSEEELEQLKNSLGAEKFDALMKTLNYIDNPSSPSDPDLFMDSSGNLIQRLPTGSFPVEEKIAPDTLSKPESEEIKTTFNDLSDYAPAMEIKENATAFSKTIQDFVENMEIEETPSVYYLTATETYLDKDSPILNRSLDQIKKDILAQDLPANLGMDRLVALRKSLISYAENLEKSNSTLLENANDIESFGKILVQTNQSKELKLIAELSSNDLSNENKRTYMASNSPFKSESSHSDSYSKIPFFDDSVTQKLEQELNDATEKMIATNITPQLKASQIASNPTYSAPAVAPKGLFVITDGKNENILNYTSEVGSKTNMIFIDIDNDGDEDLIYSMGGDVYIKENYKKTNNKSKGKVISVSGKNNSVSSYVNKGGTAVQGVFAPSDNNESADIDWIGTGNPNTVAYEIILRNSIYGNMNSPLFSYIALVNPPDHDSSVNILKKLKMNPPVDGEENPKVFEMSSPTSGSISIKIPNGNYYATVFAMDKDMNKSLPSEFAITSPQVCADKEAPFPAIDTSYRVPIMKEFELDASNSFDVNGKIIEYYLEPLPYSSEGKPVTALPLKMWSDANVMFDSDGDGIPWNDKSNPIFKIGPFTKEGDVGVREFVLHVVDQSGNSSSQKFSLEVFVPNISLDETLARDPIVTGQTDPAVEKMPFSLMRKRFIYRCTGGELKLVSRLKKVATASISPQQKYYTDDSGNYKIMDLVTKDIIIVENSSGVVIAEINPKTGDIGITKDGYSVKVNEAVPPQRPTSVEIVDANGNVLGSVYVISDANVDVTLYQNFVFETAEFMTLSGVHVSDLYASDDFAMKKFPTNDPRYPGGAGLVYLKENKYLAFIDTSGNIVLSDPRASLAQKKNNHEEDPLILEIRFNDKAVAEVYISAMKAGDSGILVAEKDVPYTTPRAPSDLDLHGPAYKKGEYMPGTLNILDQFIGPIPTTASPDYDEKDMPDMIDDFYKRGLIGDILAQSDFKLDLNNAVTRAEFVNILLNMLCIIPRQPEAYVSYSAAEGFSDMKYASGQIPWFFPYIKEAAMDDRQLVDGYRGPSDLDPITGLPPFRPERNITRAEATKIIIRALVMQGVLDGSKINEEPEGDSPWYESYINASVDLTGYLKTSASLEKAFILTPAEAQFPNKKITFKDLLTMTLRVIRLYDCWIIDADLDGISDFWEKKHGVDDPNGDPDGDGLTNLQEFEFGSGPVDADTDGGGALDGDEYKWGTDPLNPFDDPFDNDGDGLTNLSETLIYKTDPNNPDTDGGCANDGLEIANNTNPLDPIDDGANCNAPAEDVKDGDLGLYIVPAECNTCPCISTFDHKADIIPTDVMFSIISNFDETHIFSKSNEVPIDSVILK
ncbi:MAG: FG-GAP-like repeat-containing protein, partial [Candidatus Gracilibacteria bacterium]|nr:FG-GAP-like repeat-containing protein [Candidatus Gracilibacteria bacterium]